MDPDIAEKLFAYFKNCILIITRDLCKKNCTDVLLRSIFIKPDYALIYLHTKSTHFDNSRMVNWVNLVQKLTKKQGIM